MEKLIISQNIHWKQRYKNLYSRSILTKIIDRLSLRQIEVLQGIRRSGKSTIFKLLINYLSKNINPKEILYINLDDPFFVPFSKDATKFYDVIEYAKKLTGREVKYLFLDEIQAIDGWERFVKSAYDSELFKKIFVTGSNSSFLNSKLSILLTGRYLSTMVYPLTFKEILQINKIDSYIDLVEQKAKSLSIVDDMMQNGSFVEVFDAPNFAKRDIVKHYYETILFKDCVLNNSIREVKSFRDLSFYILNNASSLYSYLSLAKSVGINDTSTKEYIRYLEDSFMLYEVKQFSYSLKEQNSSKKKIYLSDNGFMLLGLKFSSNLGLLLENLVFSELLKSGFELYFYNKDFECDFIAKKEDKLIALQVCYELNEKNLKREIRGLNKLPFNCDEKYIITYNQEDNSKDIKIVPFWKFAFELPYLENLTS